jgi:hypothetical protein
VRQGRGYKAGGRGGGALLSTSQPFVRSVRHVANATNMPYGMLAVAVPLHFVLHPAAALQQLTRFPLLTVHALPPARPFAWQ